MKGELKGAVFLDRDGTISEEVGYIRDLEQFRLMPQSAEAVRLMNACGLTVIVVTNQAGVAKGHFSEEMVNRVHEKMETLLSNQGAVLDGVYYCPHHPEGVVETHRKTCACRKPGSGMIEKALKEHPINISHSYMVGDKITDVECAQRLGVKNILVLTGYGTDALKKMDAARMKRPDYIADDVLDAARWIINDLDMKRDGDTDCKIECHR